VRLPTGRSSSPSVPRVLVTEAGGLVDALFLSNWIYSGEWEEWDCSMARGARVGRK